MLDGVKPFLRPGVVFSGASDGSHILDLIDLRHLSLNTAAHDVLKLCNGKHSVEEIIASLEKTGDSSGAAGELDSSVRSFVAALVERDVLLAEAPRRVESASPMPPGVVFLEITRRCNLKCIWCYNNSSSRYNHAHKLLGRELTTEQWKRCIDQLSGAECTLLFTGGEALLRRDLLNIAAHARGAGFHTQLFTNGTLIKAHNAAAIAGHFDYVRITIDGATASTNDAVRGNGSFDNALRGMQALIDAGARVCWQAIISQLNIHELPAILRMALDVGASGLRMASVDPIGRGCDTRQLELSHAQEFVFWRFLTWAMEEYKSKIQIDWGADYCLEDAWLQTMEIEPGKAPSATPEGRRNPDYYMRFVRTSQCGVGTRSFLINAQGLIGLCPLLGPPEHTLGSVLTDDPLDVWYHNPVFSVFRDSTLEDFDDCSHCGFRYRCLGGCRGGRTGS